MITETFTPREWAHRLVEPLTAAGAAPAVQSAAASRICDQLYRELSRWVGADACHGLFARALARTQSGHPALREIRLGGRPDSCLEGVAESVQVHGASTVAAGLEEMLVALMNLLVRLVGEGVAGRLAEQSMLPDTQDPASPGAGRAAP